MKTILNHSLAVIAAVTFMYSAGHSQIVCTALNPNIVNTGNATQDIDVNNDLTHDFRLTSVQIANIGFVIVQANQIGTNNSVLTNGSGSASCLPLNAVIGPTSTTWVQMNGTNQIMTNLSNTTVTGPWASAVDQYLGVRFIVGLNTYYGWVKFSFSNSANTYTLSEYAYNSVPNQHILAGQGCASLTNPAFTLPSSICTGGTATVSANTGTAPATQYIWLGSGPAVVISNSSTPTTAITFTSPGTYTVALVVTSGTIIGVAQNTIEVGFTTTVSNSGPACSGQSITLSASGGSTYLWSGPLGYSSSLQNPVISPLSSGNAGNYSVFVTSAIGCTAIASTTVSVTLGPTLNVSPSSFTRCGTLGPPQTLSATGSTNYSWSPAAGLSTTTGATVAASPVVTTVYTVTGITGGCSGIATTTITVLAQTLFNISISSPSLCAQGHNGSANSLTISSTVVQGVSDYSFSLSPVAGFNAVNQNSNTIALTSNSSSLTGNTTFTMIGTSAICPQFMTPISLTIVQNPTVIITSGSIPVCSGNQATVVVTGASSYSWNTALPGIVSSNSNIAVVNPTSSTTYSVFGSDQGCNSATETISVTVHPLPVLTVSDKTICNSQSASISATGALNYSWTGPAGFSANGASVSIPPSGVSIKVFTVTGTDQNSCTATSTLNLHVISCTGIGEREVFSFRIHPNPVKDHLSILTPSPEPVRIEIFDLTGKKVLSRELSGSLNYSADMKSWPCGLYLLSMQSSDGTQVLKKIIRE